MGNNCPGFGNSHDNKQCLPDPNSSSDTQNAHQNDSSDINMRVLHPVPTKVLTPVPTKVLTPVPTKVLTPVPTKVLTPVPTKVLTPVPTKQRVRAVYAFEGINEDDLSFKKGDLMDIEDAISGTKDWWLAVHVESKKRGYIPSNYVIRDDTSPQSQDWWFEYDRKRSDQMLLLPGNPQGTFLVREATDKSTYVLSIRTTDKASGDPCVKHYKIRKLDNDMGYFISAKRIFPSVLDVISHFKGDTSDALCCRLTSVCPRIRPVVQFRELEISRDNIRLSTKLGAGCFGEVWKGTLRKVVEVAVKTLRPGTMSSEAFLNEAKIMHRLTHHKLVQLLAVVSAEEPFYIITEIMVNGALLDFLRSEKGKRLKFDTLIDMNSQIAEGMTYLEGENFIHRDLRAANILVGEYLDVKVADFGLARILDNDDEIYEAQQDSKYPVKWTAPEAVSERKFSVKSDVWSFGVLMYEIITFGKVPYPGMTGAEVVAKVDRGFRMEKPSNGLIDVPDSYFNMMLKCWHRIPEQRLTFHSLHDSFKELSIALEPNYKNIDDM